MTAPVKRRLSIAVLVAAIATATATLLTPMSTKTNAPPLKVTVIGDPPIADGPTVLKEMERDALATLIGVPAGPTPANIAAALMIVSVMSAVGSGTTVAGRVPPRSEGPS
ncbi:MAG: hypothetical protein ACXWE5_02395 [Actinomycetota bacterium]